MSYGKSPSIKHYFRQNHQWMLKLLGENLMGNTVPAQFSGCDSQPPRVSHDLCPQVVSNYTEGVALCNQQNTVKMCVLKVVKMANDILHVFYNQKKCFLKKAFNKEIETMCKIRTKSQKSCSFHLALYLRYSPWGKLGAMSQDTYAAPRKHPCSQKTRFLLHQQ